jgi:hypothetical protein
VRSHGVSGVNRYLDAVWSFPGRHQSTGLTDAYPSYTSLPQPRSASHEPGATADQGVVLWRTFGSLILTRPLDWSFLEYVMRVTISLRDNFINRQAKTH